jgi:WD40 repeat protein
LATGDYSGFLQTWDIERLDVPSFSVKGHSSIINAVDGVGGLNVGYGAPELVTGSRDGHVKVWDVRQTEPVVRPKHHRRISRILPLALTQSCWLAVCCAGGAGACIG